MPRADERTAPLLNLSLWNAVNAGPPESDTVHFPRNGDAASPGLTASSCQANWLGLVAAPPIWPMEEGVVTVPPPRTMVDALPAKAVPEAPGFGRL